VKQTVALKEKKNLRAKMNGKFNDIIGADGNK
jgi:hypothetical protein